VWCKRCTAPNTEVDETAALLPLNHRGKTKEQAGCRDLAGQKSPIRFRLLSRSSLKLILPYQERTYVKLAATFSVTKTWLPSANTPVRAEAWGISKKPPITDFCLGVDDPKPDRLREDRWHLIVFQPEDHRRAVPRCGADWGPIPSHGLPDTFASSPREVQAANRRGNGRRENLIAIFIHSFRQHRGYRT
jgi:hypothetical protein